MAEERVQEIIEALEKNPDMPYLILREDQALDTYVRIRLQHPGAKLAVKKGMHYITISDRALESLLDQLEKERLQMQKVLETYDREIAGIRSLMERKETGIYWSEDSYCRPPATAEERKRYKKELEGKCLERVV